MLEVKNISFAYHTNQVIDNISFTVAKGENVAIIGESGSGKSSLLKLLYGLYNLDSGSITWNNTLIRGPKFNLIPGEAYIKYLAQDFDLMPYITVAENVGKFLSNVNKALKEERVYELLSMVEMADFAHIKTKDLSGGQQQRVALAKVLAVEPEMLLLDEPFSQIDSFRKGALRRNLFKYFKNKGITCLIATHDSTEALSFSDEIIVLKEGKMLAKEPSKNLYHNPPSLYVASLFGEVNEVIPSILNAADDNSTPLFLYPHQLQVVAESEMKVVVKQCYFKGSHYLIKAAWNGKALFFDHDTALELNQEVCLDVFK